MLAGNGQKIHVYNDTVLVEWSGFIDNPNWIDTGYVQGIAYYEVALGMFIYFIINHSL